MASLTGAGAAAGLRGAARVARRSASSAGAAGAGRQGRRIDWGRRRRGALFPWVEVVVGSAALSWVTLRGAAACAGPDGPAAWISRHASSAAWVSTSAGAAGGAVGDGEGVFASPPFLRVPVAGDGRCMFRAVARGIAFSKGMVDVAPLDEQHAADQLRAMCVGEMRKRRDEIEWALEGPFDAYVERMGQPTAWGGEPELLMLSHALGRPIRVFIPREGLAWQSSGSAGLVPADAVQGIATYNEGENGGGSGDGETTITVLFDGVGHYELLVQL